MGDPDERDGLCGTCAAAPHGRDCSCDECEAYWSRVCRESSEAADRANRALVCTCGWTGPYIEHHHDRGPGCVVLRREDVPA